jgi:thiamine biosynthesis lipoprotein
MDGLLRKDEGRGPLARGALLSREQEKVVMNRRKMIWASLGLGAVAATAGWSALASGDRKDLKPFSLSGHALGTSVSLLALHHDEGLARSALAEALDEIKAVDALMSIYRDDSQLATLNRTGELRGPDARVLEVLRYSNSLAERTQGAFDVTVQPLWLAYTEAKAQGGLPTAEVLRAAREKTGWRGLEISDEVVRLRPGMAVTLNGVAQGYAADRALAALRRHGVAHALIDAGEFDTLGRKPQGKPWMLGVQDPRNADVLAIRLAMDGRALATSGDYESFFTPDFVNHHIFDPATGHSPGRLACASALAPDALQADGLSTAFMVLGPEGALALAATLPGVDALLIGKSGERWQTPGLSALAV